MGTHEHNAPSPCAKISTPFTGINAWGQPYAYSFMAHSYVPSTNVCCNEVNKAFHTTTAILNIFSFHFVVLLDDTYPFTHSCLQMMLNSLNNNFPGILL